MRYAPVVPPYYIHQLPPTEASFCYATIALQSDIYREHFAGKPYLVMDNPIYERDSNFVTPQQLKSLIEVMQPHFAIIPDVLNDFRATCVQARGYLELIDNPCLTGVPQGRSLSEITACAKYFYEYGVRRFGLSIVTSRALKLKRSDYTAMMLSEIGPDLTFHWLGADYPYLDERASHDLPSVESCDTAEPFNAAFTGGRYDTEALIYTARPRDFESMQYAINGDLLKSNILVMQEWLANG